MIKHISIKKLFGYIDIDTNISDGKVVYYGENGIGKTTFLNMMYCLLSGDSKRFALYNDYEELKITFENEVDIWFKNVVEWPNDKNTSEWQLAEFQSFDSLYKSYIRELKSAAINWPDINGIDILGLVEQIESRNIDVLKTNSQLRRELNLINNEFQNIYGDAVLWPKYLSLMIKIFQKQTERRFNNQFDRMAQIIDASDNKVIYLNSHRTRPQLTNEVKGTKNFSPYVDGNIIEASPRFSQIIRQVRNATNSVKNVVQNTYNSMSRNLLVDILEFDQKSRSTPITLTEDELDVVKSLINYMPDLSKYHTEKLLQILRGSEKAVFESILKDTMKKATTDYLKITKPIEDNIKLFVKTIDGYLVNKVIKFNSSTFSFYIQISGTDKPLTESVLSSGERHIILMMASIIFEKAQNVHVLIDEPELSLLINWQKRIINDICSFNSVCTLIVITHSPYIVSDKYSKHLQPFTKHE